MPKSELIDIRLGETVLADRTFVYELLAGLSELHGRRCADIGGCGDMEEATVLAKTLESIVFAYNDVENAAAALDDRPACLLGTEEETDPDKLCSADTRKTYAMVWNNEDGKEVYISRKGAGQRSCEFNVTWWEDDKEQSKDFEFKDRDKAIALFLKKVKSQ